MLIRQIPSLILVFIFLFSYSSPIQLFAQTAEELQGDLDSLSAQIKSLDAEIKSYSSKVAKTQGEAKTLKQALINLENRKALLAKDISYTKLRILRTQDNITTTKGRIDSTESVLDRNKKALSESLRSLAQSEQYIPAFIGVLAPGSHLSDAIEIMKRGSEASRAINHKVRELIDIKMSLSLQKASYESSKHVLENLNKTLTNQKDLVTQTSKDKNSLLVQTKNRESEYQKLLAVRKAKKDKLESEMLDVESKLRVFVDASKLPDTGKGVLQYPVEDIYVTQYFGKTAFST
ncbi:MAG: hypothetical protein K9L31_03115, partial [Candidatus Pacebacteria bacterium]|nr:hypothetical protein [Candidatus Paceibacterota bacterium]